MSKFLGEGVLGVMTIRIAICIITYLRPESLERTLQHIDQLNMPSQNVDLVVFVIDNDENGSAKTICDKSSLSRRSKLNYIIECEPGIPAARNRALAEVPATIDLLLFIDDDEWPDRRWLCEMLLVQKRTGADIVAGPVEPEFPKDAPNWVKQGKFFDRKRSKSERMTWGLPATNNVMICKHALIKFDLLFDTRLQFTGGSDTLFFMKAVHSGARIAWADAAVVFEGVPASRMTVSWLVRRWYRLGNCLVICEILIGLSFYSLVIRMIKSSAQIIIGAFLLFLGSFLGKAYFVSGLCRIARGLGSIMGMLRLTYKEYRRV